MALAADAIDDDAGDAEPPGHKLAQPLTTAAADCARPRNVDDHGGSARPAPPQRRPRRRCARLWRERRRTAPWRLRTEHESRVQPTLARRARPELGRHGPGIEIDAFAARRGGVKGRIDIIGAGLQADNVDPAPLERAQEAEGRGRFAATGAGRGDHEPARHGLPPHSGQALGRARDELGFAGPRAICPVVATAHAKPRRKRTPFRSRVNDALAEQLAGEIVEALAGAMAG